MNRGATSATARFAAAPEWEAARPEELWAGGAVRAPAEGSLEIDVPAAAARIVTVRRSGDPAPANP